MGFQLLLLPLLFLTICISALRLQDLYLRWKMKKKKEAAKMFLVNIMQLSNPTLISPKWPQQPFFATDPVDKNDLPAYDQLIADEGPCTCEDCRMYAQNPNVLSTVVTLREEQEPPPPSYADLYDSKEMSEVNSVFFIYKNPLVLTSLPSAETPWNVSKIDEGFGKGYSENGGRGGFSQCRIWL